MSIYCKICQTENKENVYFCKKCGSQIKNMCSNCSFLMETDAEFCGMCGKKYSNHELLTNNIQNCMPLEEVELFLGHEKKKKSWLIGPGIYEIGGFKYLGGVMRFNSLILKEGVDNAIKIAFYPLGVRLTLNGYYHLPIEYKAIDSFVFSLHNMIETQKNVVLGGAILGGLLLGGLGALVGSIAGLQKEKNIPIYISISHMFGKSKHTIKMSSTVQLIDNLNIIKAYNSNFYKYLKDKYKPDMSLLEYL